jgi:hypothetical protein
LKQGPPQQVERHPSIGTAPHQSFRTTGASSCGFVTSNKSNVPRRAAPIANFPTNESRTMSVDQGSSSDSFVNGGAASTCPRSGGTPAAGGSSANNNGHSTAARPGRNATGLAIDNDHSAAFAATSTTSTAKPTEENANNRPDAAPWKHAAARKPAVESRQRFRTASGTPRVLRPRTGDAASSNPPTTTTAKAARIAEAGGASVSAGAARKTAASASAAPSGKPNKRRKKGSQSKQPEIGQLAYAYYDSWEVKDEETKEVRCPARMNLVFSRGNTHHRTFRCS